MATQYAFYWGPHPAEGGGNFTLQPGITPSQAILRLLPSASYRQIDDLRLATSVGGAIFRNCRLSRSVIHRSDGPVWREVTIQDRRWMWGSTHFAISGEYNRYGAPLGAMINRKSVHELAILCLDALGEIGYAVSGLPKNIYPQVAWDSNNPAEILEQLCQTYGCILALTQADRVVIQKNGYGLLPRNDPRQYEFEMTEEPPVVPRALVFEGGEMWIQYDLPLRAVGQEANGRYSLIDGLSYKPATGWETEDPNRFQGVTNAADRALARASVWRTYQIEATKPGATSGAFKLPLPVDSLASKVLGGKLTQTQRQQTQEYYTIKGSTTATGGDGTQWRILPVNDHQQDQNVPYQVLGYFYAHNNANTNNDPAIQDEGDLPAAATDYDQEIAPDPAPAASKLILPSAWIDRLDQQNGRLHFNQPVFLQDFTNNEHIEARIRLRCSFPLRDPESAAPICPQYWFFPNFRGVVNIPKMIKNSEFSFSYSKKNSDASSFIAGALGALANELASYEFPQGYYGFYKGFILDIPPDGIVRAIQYDVSDAGEATTQIDYGIERPDYYLTLDELRARRMNVFHTFVARETARKQKRFRGNPNRRILTP